MTAPRSSGFALACAATVVALTVCFANGLEQPGKAPREALLLLAAPMLLAVAVFEADRRPWRGLRLAAGVVVAAAVAGTLAVPAPERWATLRDTAAFLVPGIGALAAARFTGSAGRRVDLWLERGAGIGLLVAGSLGLAQVFGWDGLFQARPPAATFVNRNVAAQSLLLLLPLGVGLMLSARQALERWGGAIATGLGCALLIATRSRGAWTAAAIGLLTLIAIGWGRRQRLSSRSVAGPLALVVTVAIASTLLPASAPQLPSVRGTLGTLTRPGVGSGDSRIAIWRNTVELLERAPVRGHGPGRFGVVYPQVQASRTRTPGFGTTFQPERAHNDWIEFAVEIGLPAGACLLVLSLIGIGISWRRGRGSTTDPGAHHSQVRAAALAAVTAHAMLSFPLHSPLSAWLFGLLVGRALAGWSTALPTGRGRLRLPIVALSVGAAVLGAGVGLRELQAQRGLGEALTRLSSGDCAGALRASEAVDARAPWRRRELGMATMIRFDCDKDPATTAPLLERALDMQPDQLNLLLAAGGRRFKLGELEAALRHYERASRVAPGLAAGWTGIAMTELARNDRFGAARACRRALEVDPRDRAALYFCSANGLVP